LAVATGASSAAWTALPETLLTRTEVAAARVGDAVYVVGGFDERTSASTTAVERLDLRTGRWSLPRPMPIALNHMGAASYGGSLYVLGGYRSQSDTNSDATNSFWRYDPATDQWSAMPPAPTPRAAFATAVLGNRLYAAAGRNDDTLALTSVDVFDFSQQRWLSAPSLRVAREHVAGAAAGGAVYVLGGRERGVGYFATVERYVPGSDHWQELTSMPVERSGFEVATLPRRIVAVGGEAGEGVIGEVDSLNLATGAWERLPPMRTPRHGLGVVSAGPVLLTIEGGPVAGLTYSRAVERLLVR
jgi:N-acetylneuraminic acid mutarotase